MDNVLSLALETLSWIELKNMSCSSALARSAKQLAVSDKKTVAKASSLVRNVLFRKNFIDRVLNLALASTSLDDLNLGNQSFLRIFVFKAKFDLIGVDEAVELARAGRSILGWESLMSVEEFLGRILRLDAGEVLSGLDEYSRISIQTFYPRWFVDYCVRLMGRGEALRLLNYHVPPPRYVRVNTLKGSEEVVLKEISSSGIVLDKIEDIPFLYRVTRGAKMLAGLEAYTKGLFSFQDVASCLASLSGAPRPGCVVLDVGARPISNTIYLAQLMNNAGKIFSIDSSARRMEALAREVDRANVDIVEPVVVEMSETPMVTEKADLVLLSPACSCTGVFWREPSLKWKVDFKGVEGASNVQWSMINKYAACVKDGGSLVYWTRSVTVEENELLIERFLNLHPEFSLVEARPRIGVSGLRGQRECQRLYPHLQGADGSYFARLIKHEQT